MNLFLNKSNYTVILFYLYRDINDTKEVMAWQKNISEKYNLKGRVIVSPEGINGTLCGIDKECSAYMDEVKKNSLFFDIDFKINYSPFICFDKLKIKYRPEIIMLRSNDIAQKADSKREEYYISPEELHQLLLEKKDILLFDTRNNYEMRIGHFYNAYLPSISNSKEFYDFFKNNKKLFENKEVVMYCSGGSRCEKTSMALRSLNVCKKIRHLKRGIHGYIEKYPDGFFKGRYYVFDDRISLKISQDILTHCDICNISCDLYNNCLNALCNLHHIACNECLERLNGCCSHKCYELTKEKRVPLRNILPSRSKLYREC